jgi:hypothetical protein
MANKLGTDEYLIETQDTLETILNILNKVNQKLPDPKVKLRMTLGLMVYPIIESGYSLLFLSRSKKLRDCYILARPILEHVLNIGYFGAKGNDAIMKAINHTHQKSYRDLKREITIKDIKIALGLKNIESYPINDSLRVAIEEFTTKKGFEERAWSGDNTYKKIEIISDRYGKNIATILSGNLFFIYRHSSEVIHGTLFGVSYCLGLTDLTKHPTKSDKEYSRFINVRLSLVILNIMLLVSCSLKIIHEHFPISDEVEEVSKLISQVRQNNQ